MIGAPFIDGYKLADRLNDLNLAGVMFNPIYFIPTFNKYKGQVCGGVQVHVTDRRKFQAVRTGAMVVQTLYQMYPGNLTISSGINEMFGLPDFQSTIKTTPVDDILKSCQSNYDQFQNIRKQYLFYGTSGEEDELQLPGGVEDTFLSLERMR